MIVHLLNLERDDCGNEMGKENEMRGRWVNDEEW